MSLPGGLLRGWLGLAQAPESAGDAGLNESLRFADLPEAWVLLLIVLPLALAVAWIAYRGERLPTAKRALLVGLRLAAILILLAVIARPVRVQRREEVRAPEVAVLIDDSASMRRIDAYTDDGAKRDALARLLSERSGSGDRVQTSRSRVAEALLQRELLPLLARGGYVPKLYTFADTVAQFEGASGALPRLEGRGVATHLGDALSQVLAAHRGRHLTDIVVLSDGRSNGGTAPTIAARAAAAAGVPVHTLVIGDTRPERNAVVELVEAPTSALEGDEIAITVRVLGRGTGGASGTARSSIELAEFVPDSRGGAGEGREPRVLETQDIVLEENGRRVTLIARPGPSDPRTGERRFRVTVPPLPGETLLDDNSIELSVHVTLEKVRVLYVEGYPRWEYRFLKNMLLRADENLAVQCFLLSAADNWPQETTAGITPLEAVPTDRKELLENYDVIILGDVSPFEVSPDPARAEAFQENLAEFVVRGGGLLLLAGEYANPISYIRTPLEDLFPVVLDAAELQETPWDSTRAFHPRLEDPLQPHEIVRLHPDENVNRILWEDEAQGLYGQYWFSPVSRPKPGSLPLLRHPDARNTHGAYPLLVAGYYPAGRTLFVGIDSTFMWRYHYGDTYYERFWRNALRWLSLGRLKSGDRRYRVETARATYHLGERVAVEARVLDEDFRPSEKPAQEIWWSGPSDRPQSVQLPAVAGRAGVYRGSLEVERPGVHRVWIEVASERVTSAEFEVTLPSAENQEPAPDPALLREIAALSRGQALELEAYARLAEAFPGNEERREPISSRLEDIWDTWATLLAALGLLATEWILRKRMDLV